MTRSARRIPDAIGRGLHRFEHLIGAEREGRSAWVWLGPLITIVGTFVLAMKVSGDGGLGLAASLPLAFILCTFMGGMSIAYLTAAAADLRDSEADDDGGGGDGGGGRGPDRPTRPRPGRSDVLRWVEVVSVRRDPSGDSAPPAERDREPERVGGAPARRR